MVIASTFIGHHKYFRWPSQVLAFFEGVLYDNSLGIRNDANSTMPTLGTVSNHGWAINYITASLSAQVTDLLSG